MIIGQGSIKIGNDDSMESIIKRLYSITNPSSQYIQQRINRLKGIESHGANVLQEYTVEMEDILQSDTESERLINNIKKDYMIRNLMSTASHIADYTNKVICIIYLIGQKYHIQFKDKFKLEMIKTEFDYINKDNAFINDCLAILQKDLDVTAQKLNKLRVAYSASTTDEIESIIDEFTDDELYSVDTGRIYRRISRRLGERFTKEDKEVLAKFLSNYKSVRKRETKLNIPYLCKIFKINSEDYEARKYSAIEPIVQLSALDLLAR